MVRARARQMLDEQARCWTDALRPELAAHGIRFLDPHDYTEAIASYLADYFSREIAPVLTPLAFDPGHPFPHISNRSKNLAVAVKHEGRTKFARIKLPPVLPRFIQLPAALAQGDTVFAFLEDIVCANVQSLFPGTAVKSAHVFRVIRDSDMVIQEDEADDLLETVDQGLRQLRHGAPSLLQVEERMPRRVLDILMENFEIDDAVLVRTSNRFDLGDWMELTRLHRPELKEANFAPRIVWGRQEADEIFELVRHRDCNYNASTARVYTDLGLVTSRAPIVEDVTNVFNYLTGYSGLTDYQRLLVAPVSLRRRISALIDRERAHAAAGRPARIVLKVNSITDPEMIQQLYRASQSGVRMDLIVRGICCLRPGVPGVSDNITVRSIVGRFLEHSRIYSLENGGSPEAYIGSADLMERNLDRRVEVLCPVLDRDQREYLRDTVLGAYLRDTDRASLLGPDGTYAPALAEDAADRFNAQLFLLGRHTSDYAQH